MFTFINPVVDFKEFIKAFADAMGAKLVDNRVTVPDAIGRGYLQLEELPNGLSAIIMNFVLHTDMHYEQAKSNEEWYSLRFEEIDVTQSLITKIDEEYINDSRHLHTSAYLICSLFDVGYYVTKGTHMNCIQIQMSRDWLGRYLKMDVFQDIVQQYISLKTASLHLEPLDSEYKRVVHEVGKMNEGHPTHKTMVHNRIMYLVERFFTHLYEKRDSLHYQVKASMEDIERVRDVEAAITADITAPYPGIDKLSRLAAMSPSKLKQLFKDIYGKPLYQYYQYNRMQKAKAMLLSQKFSIKEVGMSLGYSNLSNFSAAFRKEFNILPSQLLAP